MSQVVETNKTIIKRYFEAYNTKNEAIFDEIIGPDYIDHGQRLEEEHHDPLQSRVSINCTTNFRNKQTDSGKHH